VLVGHRLVRAERDEEVERRGPRPSVAVSASNMSAIGIVRVASGMSTRRRLPSTGAVANPSATIRRTSASERWLVVSPCPISIDVNPPSTGDRPQAPRSESCLGQTPLNAEKPPSMGITTPVTNADAGDSSQSTAPVRSSGWPNRPMGVC